MTTQLLNKLRIFCFLTLLLLAGKTVNGQSVKFSEDPGQFITEVKTLMEKSGNPAYAKSAQNLETIWMSSINGTQQKELIGLMRRLAAKGQKAGPVFHLLLQNLHTTASSSGDVNGFLIMIDKATDKYDGKTLQKLLESVKTILDKKQLYSSNFSKLYLTGGQYRFRFDDSKPDAGTFLAAPAGDGWDTPADSVSLKIQEQPLPTLSGALLDLQNATFAIVTAHDSVTFGPSTGSVSLREGTFVGKDGKFTWAMAGDSTIYVDLNNYTFNIATPKLTLSNTTLHYADKLKNAVKGAFEFKSIKHIAGKPHSYPRFVSNRTDAELIFTSKNIDYRGGLSIIGNALYSTSLDNQPSFITVRNGTKKAFQASSLRFALKDSVISADIAQFNMPLGKDSLYHPGVRFRYNDQEGALRLERADKTVYGDLPYLDSYHKMGIWAEGMRWDFPKEKVEFYMIAGKQVVPVRLESFDYFKPRRFQAIAEEFGFQPLLMAANYVQTKKKQSFTYEELATNFKQNPVIVKNALERLTIQGYFTYDDATAEYRVTKKGILYILANFDKGDYDNFQINSQFEANKDVANATISLKDTLMTVRGVDRFVVSDSLKISASPSDKKVVIGKNRDFLLNGQLRSANFRFAGQDLKFNYDKFFVNLNQVDSITYTPQEKFAKGMTSEVGGHVKYEKGGTFYLSDPKNKSGHQKGLKSPRIVIPDGMTVFFDQPVRKLVQYPREVFFKIPKLDFDSLDQRDIVFSGTFTSGGIMAPFKTILKSMPDNSLGFEYQAPATGLKIYEKANLKFSNKLVMDNSGLHTKGTLSYLSASFPADSMLLMSDSLMSSGAEASIKEATIGKGYFPGVVLKNYSLKWIPKSDSMLIITKGNSFSFYKGTTQLEGGLLLRTLGLYGNGLLKRADSEVQSLDIKFNKDGFFSKKSQFTVKEGQQDSFRAILLGKNVDVDFNVIKGFVDLTTDSKGFSADSSLFEFPYAAYRTSIDKARWNINNKTIAMKGDVNNSTFTATAEEQEGLTFNGSAALYEVDKMMLNISGVPYIRTADVKIIPDKGLVGIRKNGEMQEFKKARIEIDTLNSSHRMRDATIKITSRNRFEGSATYQYITARKDTFNIKMENFELHEANVAAGKERKTSSKQKDTPTATTTYYTTARAAVSEDDKLTLSPRIQYKGDVKLIAYEPSLQLDGFVRPLLKNRPELTSSWITYKEAPGKVITIKVNKTLKNEGDQPLFAGLHFSQGRGMYITFLSTKENDRDQDIFLAEGEMGYDEAKKSFKILPPVGADSLSKENRAFTFDDQKGIVNFSGPLQLSSTPLIKASGLVKAQVDSSRFDFNTLLLVNLPSLTPFVADIAKKIVQTNLDEQNSDPAESDPERLNLKLAALIGDKAANDYQTKTAGEYKPVYEAAASLDVPLAISNVDMRWSDTHGAFYSTGPIGVAHLGKNDINAQMEGIVEIRRTDRGDEFTMYLEVTPDIWFYFGYSQGQLGVLSSDIELNDILLAKSKNAKTKDMELISIDIEEKNMFLDRFNEFYQPALKKAKVKAAQKKEIKKKETKKKEEATEGF